MKLVSMVAVLLLSVGLLMTPIAATQSGMFAGYAALCGVPVIVAPNPQSATASRDQNGHPMIYVDPGVMANWTMSRVFTIAHECGHHMRGHTTPQGMWWRNTQYWATRAQELDADCWAASVLARQGYYRADIERAAYDFAMQGPFRTNGYPSGQERAQQIARCAR